MRIVANSGIATILFLIVGLLMDFKLAIAHGVTVFAWVESDTVHVESKFSGGRRPMNAPVEVYDARGNLLLTGKTDDNGEFSFKVPIREEMKVVLQAGMGHRGEWTIPLSDLTDVDLKAASEPPATGTRTSDMAVQNNAGLAASTANSRRVTAANIPAEDIRAIVEEALDAKLKPMMKVLVETQQRGPSVADILGGIGYIMGLVGLAAYVSAKRSK